MSKARPSQLDSPLMPKVLRIMSKVNTAVYRATGGLIGSKWRVGSAFPRGVPVCLFTSTGRKSKQPRTTPLLYLPDGDRVIVVASQGGMPRHPAWYLNITSDPEVTVQVKRQVRRMRARVADERERAELWPRLVRLYADFDAYQSWTERQIPVVICEPVS